MTRTLSGSSQVYGGRVRPRSRMIFDCHLDLAMNAVHWNRDLTKPLEQIRARESGLADKPDRGRAVVSLEEMRRGEIRICVATQIAHSVSQQSPLQGWNSPEIAWAQTQAQLAWYRTMEDAGYLTSIRSAGELKEFRNDLGTRDVDETGDDHGSIGYLLSLEGADSLVELDYLQRAYNEGLRLLGPAHYGPGRYAAGTGESDGFTLAGFELLDQMEQLGIILDVTHLTDLGFDQALERYSGPLIASHHNCRTLVDHQRQLTDDQIQRLVERGAIIGAAFDAWMLVPNWVRGSSTPEGRGVTLANVADQIDHVCQLTGGCQSIVLGTDLDGGYGFEQTPLEIQSISKVGLLKQILLDRNYPHEDVSKIMFGNAFDFFAKNLPS